MTVGKNAEVIALPLAGGELLVGTRIGRLVDWSAEHGPLVSYDAGASGSLPARSIVALDEDIVRAAVAADREVLLGFDGGASKRPVILGWIEPPRMSEEITETLPTPIEALIDGRRVVLEAAEEVVLRCGSASITLRHNGRVLIRGTHVETSADGVNRIKGGSVQIN